MSRLNNNSKITFFLIPILVLLIFIRCDDEDFPFPEVPVNVTFYLSGQLTNMLEGEYRLIDGYGVGGLIIFRSSRNEFKAFDRACTYETSKDCILADEGSYFECPCCGSNFWMVMGDIAGTVKQGPSKYPLKQYNCYFDGTNGVRVTN